MIVFLTICRPSILSPSLPALSAIISRLRSTTCILAQHLVGQFSISLLGQRRSHVIYAVSGLRYAMWQKNESHKSAGVSSTEIELLELKLTKQAKSSKNTTKT